MFIVLFHSMWLFYREMMSQQIDLNRICHQEFLNRHEFNGIEFLDMMSLRVGLGKTISEEWESVKQIVFIELNLKGMRVKQK